ncbi:MAG: acetylxylan esterase [Bryobacteraceae bacterium]
MILAPLASMAFQAAQPALGSDPPPVRLTNHEDHQRLMDLLHMTSIRRGRDGNDKTSPFYANYDESKANPYPNLPDPLTLKNGKKITKASDWWSKRRPEIVEDFDREVYGRVPKVTPKVTWAVTDTTNGMNGDVPVITKQLVGKVDNSSYPYIKVEIAVSLTTPANAQGPVPVVMQFGGFGFGAPGAGRGAPGAAGPPPPPEPPYGPGAFRAARGGARGPAGALPGRGAPGAAAPGAAAAATGAQGMPAAPPPGAAVAGAAGAPAPGTVPPAAGRTGFPGGGRGPTGPTWQQQVLAKGWGYASINPGSIQDDDGAGLTLGIIGLVNKGQPRKLDDWGTLRAWAWGVSRALDYFETDKAVDAKHVALEGHSRYGKATLVAMAYEPRLWTAYVSSSGEGGAKLHRRDWGEIVENVAGEGEYWWMAGNFLKYAGPLNWNDLPVDSHELIAMCAPRPVFISGGATNGDGWVDAKGMFMAAAGAGPVYKLLGKKDMGTTEFPPIETPLVDGDVAFRQHSSGHTDGPNWPTFLTFASRYLPPAKTK